LNARFAVNGIQSSSRDGAIATSALEPDGAGVVDVVVI
jgi:hypothetical protein